MGMKGVKKLGKMWLEGMEGVGGCRSWVQDAPYLAQLEDVPEVAEQDDGGQELLTVLIQTLRGRQR